MLHTTFAVTMAEGSAQANVLPPHAEATMSVRILQGDTVESVKKYLNPSFPKAFLSKFLLLKIRNGQEARTAMSMNSSVIRSMKSMEKRQPSCQNSCSAPQTQKLC